MTNIYECLGICQMYKRKSVYIAMFYILVLATAGIVPIAYVKLLLEKINIFKLIAVLTELI